MYDVALYWGNTSALGSLKVIARGLWDLEIALPLIALKAAD